MPTPRLSSLTPLRTRGLISGGTTVPPNTSQVLAVYCVVEPSQIRAVVAACTPGSGGATPTIVDVQVNNVSVWTDPTHRPTLAAGLPGGTFTTYPANMRALRRGDVLTIVCVQTGNRSNVAASVAIEEPT